MLSFRRPNRTFTVLISWITQLIESYGLIFVAVLICVESIALPVPGETVLILAAVFAGTRHQLDIVAVVLTAATAAFVGQVVGYMIGQQFGYRYFCSTAAICASPKDGSSLVSIFSCATGSQS